MLTTGLGLRLPHVIIDAELDALNRVQLHVISATEIFYLSVNKKYK